jgi:hypothetical protein
LLIFPIEGFSLADIEALRFTQAPTSTGGARWVHLYAATMLILVVAPRLLLAAFAHWRARSLQRRFPLDLKSPYFYALAQRAGAAAAGVLRVFPYSFTVDEARDKALSALANAALGEQTRVMLRPSCPYGEDPQALLGADIPDDPEVAANAVLFNLAATPEQENHGAFLDYVTRRCPRGVSVLVDESGLAQRSAGQPDANVRLEERKVLWRQFCGHHHKPVQFVDLLHPASTPLDLGAGSSASVPQ